MTTMKRRRRTFLQATLGLTIATIGMSGLAHAGCAIPNVVMLIAEMRQIPSHDLCRLADELL
jgi:hypothetical protein